MIQSHLLQKKSPPPTHNQVYFNQFYFRLANLKGYTTLLNFDPHGSENTLGDEAEQREYYKSTQKCGNTLQHAFSRPDQKSTYNLQHISNISALKQKNPSYSISHPLKRKHSNPANRARSKHGKLRSIANNRSKL